MGSLEVKLAWKEIESLIYSYSREERLQCLHTGKCRQLQQTTSSNFKNSWIPINIVTSKSLLTTCKMEQITPSKPLTSKQNTLTLFLMYNSIITFLMIPANALIHLSSTMTPTNVQVQAMEPHLSFSILIPQTNALG